MPTATTMNKSSNKPFAMNSSKDAMRAINKRHTGKIKQDPDWFITCLVKDPVRSFTITFDPKLLLSKKEKYGSLLILPKSMQD